MVEVAAELMNKCPQNPDTEVKKTLRQAFIKDMVPKYCNFLAKKVMRDIMTMFDYEKSSNCCCMQSSCIHSEIDSIQLLSYRPNLVLTP